MLNIDSLANSAKLIVQAFSIGTCGRNPPRIRNISFKVAPRQVVCLATTETAAADRVIELAAGLESPDEGTLLLFGRDIRRYTERELRFIRRAKAGFVCHTPGLFPGLTVFENLMIGSDSGLWQRARQAETARDLIKAIGLSGSSRSKAADLAYEDRCRVAIARAFVKRPVVVYASDVTLETSPADRIELMGLLRSLTEEYECALIASCDDPEMLSPVDTTVDIVSGSLAKRYSS